MTDQERMRAARIARLNDAFRTTSTSGIVFSAALAAEGLPTMLELLAQVRAFSAFTPDNDPFGEHDFGSFVHVLDGRSETIFWTIDTYADGSLTFGADDPLSPSAVRILTIMLASDY